jgi:hypothetical protein
MAALLNEFAGVFHESYGQNDTLVTGSCCSKAHQLRQCAHKVTLTLKRMAHGVFVSTTKHSMLLPTKILFPF